MSTVLAVEPLVRTSLADMVYDRILRAILAGSLSSGATLVVSDLARDFAVSPSPVREALLRLAGDGLVRNATNRRAMVVNFTRQELIDLFQVREILETGATRLAAMRVTDEQLQQLRVAAEQCAALFGDPAHKKEMLDLDNRFHEIVAEASGNESLKAEVKRYSHQVRVVQCLRLRPARMETAYVEHVAVLEALAARDPAAAQHAMSLHIQRAMEYVLEGMVVEQTA